MLNVISRSNTTCSRCSIHSSGPQRGFVKRIAASYGNLRAVRSVWQRSIKLKRTSQNGRESTHHPEPRYSRWQGSVGQQTVHILDVLEDAEYFWHADAGQSIGKFRTVLGVPLLREGVPFGAFALMRSDARPFVGEEIELVTAFANQAVIAIENTRLFEEVQARTREVTEALQYQTATSEVLQVISSSPGVLQPVYEAMLAKALRHCDAKFGGLFRYENGTFRGVAGIGIPEELMARWGQEASSLTSDADLQCLIASRQPMHTIDLRKNASYLAGDTFAVGTVERGGARSALLVPLVKDDALIGAFAIYRQEVLPFTEKQIQLVTTFADQAVIAIENTRLFNELRRVARISDGDRRHPAGNFKLADRCPACV